MIGNNNKPSIQRRNLLNEDQQRPQAKVWLNIGYELDDTQRGDDGYDFVSLASGIPLDQLDDLPTRSKNATYKAFQEARNDLRDQLLALAAEMQPGQSRIVNLQVQLRLVEDEPENTTAGDLNPFINRRSL